MSEAVMDVAALESAVETSVPETQDTSTETAERSLQSATGPTTSDEATSTEPEQGQTETTTKETGSALPKTISQALKALQDGSPNDPNIKSAVRQLRDAFFSNQVVVKEFGSVAAAKEAKAILSELAGGSTDLKTIREQVSSTKETLEAIAESDALLYSGDPQLVQNVVEDLKSEGKLDSLGKLAGHFLEAAKQETPEAFVELQRGLLVESLYEANFPATINTLSAALKAGDSDRAKGIVKSIVRWFSGEQDTDSQRLSSMKAAAQHQEAERRASETKYQTLIQENQTQRNSISNVELGKQLKPFLQGELKDLP